VINLILFALETRKGQILVLHTYRLFSFNCSDDEICQVKQTTFVKLENIRLVTINSECSYSKRTYTHKVCNFSYKNFPWLYNKTYFL